MPIRRAAASISVINATCGSRLTSAAPSGMRSVSTPIRLAPGTISRTSCRRLRARSFACIVMPVTLPPGLRRLAANPVLTGSDTAHTTTGMRPGARAAAVMPGVAAVTKMSTGRRASSSAIGCIRAKSFPAHRYSMTRLRPST